MNKEDDNSNNTKDRNKEQESKTFFPLYLLCCLCEGLLSWQPLATQIASFSLFLDFLNIFFFLLPTPILEQHQFCFLEMLAQGIRRCDQCSWRKARYIAVFTSQCMCQKWKQKTKSKRGYQLMPTFFNNSSRIFCILCAILRKQLQGVFFFFFLPPSVVGFRCEYTSVFHCRLEGGFVWRSALISCIVCITCFRLLDLVI